MPQTEPPGESRERKATTGRNHFCAIAYTAGAIICGAGWLAFINTDQTLPIVVLFGLAFMSARAAWRHWKPRLSVEDVDDLAEQSPVVFLRPFEEDGDWDGAAAFSVYAPRTWLKFPLTLSNLTALWLELTGRNSFEQVVAFVTHKKGPMVAIGEPGQPPILGAHNIYMGDDGWQEAIRDLLREASLVVMTAGHSPGVLWEFETVIAQVPSERVMICIPGRSRRARHAAFVDFINAADDIYEGAVPERLYRGRFLVFDKAWTPIEKNVFWPKRGTTTHLANRICRLVA